MDLESSPESGRTQGGDGVEVGPGDLQLVAAHVAVSLVSGGRGANVGECHLLLDLRRGVAVLLHGSAWWGTGGTGQGSLAWEGRKLKTTVDS